MDSSTRTPYHRVCLEIEKQMRITITGPDGFITRLDAHVH
jgi:hypothetical protein